MIVFCASKYIDRYYGLHARTFTLYVSIGEWGMDFCLE